MNNMKFRLLKKNDNIEVRYDASLPKQNPLFIKLLKVFLENQRVVSNVENVKQTAIMDASQ